MGREQPRRCRGDDGFVGGTEGILFGVVVFVFGTLILFNAWAVIDAKMAVSSAARETARTLVEGPGDVAPAVEAGRGGGTDDDRIPAARDRPLRGDLDLVGRCVQPRTGA